MVKGKRPKGSNNISIGYKHPFYIISQANQHECQILCQMTLCTPTQHMQPVHILQLFTRLSQVYHKMDMGWGRQGEEAIKLLESTQKIRYHMFALI